MDFKNDYIVKKNMYSLGSVPVSPLEYDDWDSTACCRTGRAVRASAQKLCTSGNCTHAQPLWRRWWVCRSLRLERRQQRCRRRPSSFYSLLGDKWKGSKLKTYRSRRIKITAVVVVLGLSSSVCRLCMYVCAHKSCVNMVLSFITYYVVFMICFFYGTAGPFQIKCPYKDNKVCHIVSI